MQDSASFWTDIKDLEDQLAKYPGSFCFARLSDVYLKVGLIDDALHVARQGVLKHPRYLSGQRTLSLACLAKGLNNDALAALQLITEALPEDVASQKLLGRLLIDAGDQVAACQVFRTALEFAPDDVECRIELESLERSVGGGSPLLKAEEYSIPETDEDEILEDLEILEELEIFEEDQPEYGEQFQEIPPEADTISTSQHDPLSTVTLAELYVSQGFIQKALEIYRAILADNPLDIVIAGRIAELETLGNFQTETVPETDDDEMEAEEEPGFYVESVAFIEEAVPEQLLEFDVIPASANQQVCLDVLGLESPPFEVPLQGIADNALSTLDGWLENIRRIKSCR